MSNYEYEYLQTSNSSSRAHYGAAEKPVGVTIHHWGADGQSHDGVVRWLRGENGGVENENSSAHYVTSAGRVTQLEDDFRATWHSGNRDGNGTTIGIECRPEMSGADWRTLVELCADLEERHGSLRYFRHSDWKATACPGRYGDRLSKLVRDVNAEHSRRTRRTVEQDASAAVQTKTEWPNEPLPVDGKKTQSWHDAWVELMRRVGFTDGDLGRNLQAWLNTLQDPRTGRPYYDLEKFRHDGVMGRESVKALQRFLYDREDANGRFYDGFSDGQRGPLTVKGEKRYLNYQIQFLD
ncbi:MAG: peptidoglycan recognition family protein [Micrococcus sp.]|nr:peptidoglycan recognition family protein [Micrococcus sp.]